MSLCCAFDILDGCLFCNVHTYIGRLYKMHVHAYVYQYSINSLPHVKKHLGMFTINTTSCMYVRASLEAASDHDEFFSHHEPSRYVPLVYTLCLLA